VLLAAILAILAAVICVAPFAVFRRDNDLRILNPQLQLDPHQPTMPACTPKADQLTMLPLSLVANIPATEVAQRRRLKGSPSWIAYWRSAEADQKTSSVFINRLAL
jgi:hypothetical protein